MTKTYRVRDRGGVYRSVAGDALIEAARTCILGKFKSGIAIKCPADTERYLQTMLGDRECEVFAVLFLDTRHRILDYREMFFGTVDGCAVYCREIVKAALTLNAAAIICAHNHCSGVAEPSMADERITKRLKSALELIDVRLLDHLVVAKDVVSMASRGLI